MVYNKNHTIRFKQYAFYNLSIFTNQLDTFMCMSRRNRVVFTNLSKYKYAHKGLLLWEYLLNIPETKLLASERI